MRISRWGAIPWPPNPQGAHVLAFDDASLHVDFDHHEVTIDGTLSC